MKVVPNCPTFRRTSGKTKLQTETSLTNVFVGPIMKAFITTLCLLLHISNHPSLAGENVEGWIYSLDDFPLDIHPVHPRGKFLVIPEQGRHLETVTTLTSDVRPLRARVTLLSDEEAEEKEMVELKARELLREVQHERELKRKEKGKVINSRV